MQNELLDVQAAGWHVVHLSSDPEKYKKQVRKHRAAAGAELRIPLIMGQNVRARFYGRMREDREHVYWLVHPEDVERITPGFSKNGALVCSCIVECD